MSGGPQLFKIDRENKKTELMKEVNFAQLGVKEVQDIQEWIAKNPRILGDDLLIIAKEFRNFDKTKERPDLLAVDTDGTLVVIELKSDDSGRDVHWQAIKYASYVDRAPPDRIIGMLAEHENISLQAAAIRLEQHLDEHNIDALNNDQRIILASHRFALEVTSAVLWLNEKTPSEKRITCIQLTPYQDVETCSLYVQANTIIPVPDDERYRIGLGIISQDDSDRSIVKRRSARDRNKDDDITRFCTMVSELTLRGLRGDIKPPDMRSRHAGNGGNDHSDRRHYHLWYNNEGWGNWKMTYLINMYDKVESQPWCAEVGFGCQDAVDGLKARLEGVDVPRGSDIVEAKPGLLSHMVVTYRSDVLDDSFAETLASTLRQFIEVITPKMDEELNVQSADGSRE